MATAHTHVARQTSPRKALNVFGGAYLVFRGMHFLFDIWGCIFGIWSGSQSVASSHTPRMQQLTDLSYKSLVGLHASYIPASYYERGSPEGHPGLEVGAQRAL